MKWSPRRARKKRQRQERQRKKFIGKVLLAGAGQKKKQEGLVPDWLHERMKEK